MNHVCTAAVMRHLSQHGSLPDPRRGEHINTGPQWRDMGATADVWESLTYLETRRWLVVEGDRVRRTVFDPDLYMVLPLARALPVSPPLRLSEVSERVRRGGTDEWRLAREALGCTSSATQAERRVAAAVSTLVRAGRARRVGAWVNRVVGGAA